ncbi:unnamed protein product [Heterosigma akashiwo]
MGQTIGRAPLKPEATHFLNLPRSCIHDLWECFNDVAEGFGLTQEEFQEILRVCLRDYLTYTEKKINEISSKLFDTFDDDHNGLIDALEFLASFSLVSGMTLEEKVRFIFGIYDFDESGVLNVDEMNLALWSSISGLCKLSGVDPPLESDIEHIASLLTCLSVGYGQFAHAVLSLWFLLLAIPSWVLPALLPPFLGGGAIAVIAANTSVLLGSSSSLAALDSSACYLDTGCTRGDGPGRGGEARLAQEALGPAADLPRHAPWENAVPFTEPTHREQLPPPFPLPSLIIYRHLPSSPSDPPHPTYTPQTRAGVPAGAPGVVLDLDAGGSYFLEHTDLVTCLLVHHLTAGARERACGHRAAGRRGGAQRKKSACGAFRPEPGVLSARRFLSGFHTPGVRHVAFSLRGTLKLNIGKISRHMVAVYDWAARELLFTAPGHPGAVLECRAVSHTTFVTCGQARPLALALPGTFSSFQYFLQPASWKRRRAGESKEQFHFACLLQKLFSSVKLDMVATGMLSGHLYIWEGRNCVNSIKGHSGAVTCIQALGEGGFDGCVTASSDGKVQVWSRKFEVGATFTSRRWVGAQDRMAQSLCWDREASKFLLGFYSGAVRDGRQRGPEPAPGPRRPGGGLGRSLCRGRGGFGLLPSQPC